MKTMKIPPTSHYWEPHSRIEGYELKERITTKFTRRARETSISRPMLPLARVERLVRPCFLLMTHERLRQIQLIPFESFWIGARKAEILQV